MELWMVILSGRRLEVLDYLNPVLWDFISRMIIFYES